MAKASQSRPNARIRKAVRREFILAENGLITVRQVMERAYVRKGLKRFTHWHRLSARRALRLVADVVACNRFGRGRPALWRLRTQHDAT